MSTKNQPNAPGLLPKYLADGLPKQDIETLEAAREYIDELIEWQDRPVEPADLPDDAEPVEDSDDSQQGTIVEQYRTCGDETCHCLTGGEKHGPYKYRYWREDGGLTSEYVGKAD
jgi:hypothetical protein